MQAAANKVDGDTSLALALIADRRFSAVSLRPERTSQNLSVLAVHRMITWSKLWESLKSRMSFLICSICSHLVPEITLSAREAWERVIEMFGQSTCFERDGREGNISRKVVILSTEVQKVTSVCYGAKSVFMSFQWNITLPFLNSRVQLSLEVSSFLGFLL